MSSPSQRARDDHDTSSAVEDLVVALTVGVGECAEMHRLASGAAGASQALGDKHRELLAEFSGFFLSLVDRAALSILGHDSRVAIMDYLAAELSVVMADSTSQTSDEECRLSMGRWFWSQMTNAHAAYSGCTTMFPKEKMFTSDALFSVLARRAAAICGDDSNPELLMVAMEVSTKSFSSMDIPELLAAIRRASC